ncbi:MAG: right-handed parallel beta-helix repeat-containing protein [Planctomycetes bacterium]|nr:right-handed parallel beta-helix repeat-containing protein [Planctomycetota bacterium]
MQAAAGRFYTWAAVSAISMGGSAVAQTTWYVDPDATGVPRDGTTWCTAFAALDDALAAATAPDSILVADGTFVPDATGLADPRQAAFAMKNGVLIRGGHAGCAAADPDEHDPTLFETVLSGDLNGDDGADFANRDDNCRHVVVAGASAVVSLIQSVTIMGGNADGPCCGPEANGGGIYIAGVSPGIINCTFRDNSAARGGAIANNGGSPIINGCVFRNNRADQGLETGGAIFTTQGSPEIANCLFVGNHATVGGAITNFSTTGLAKVRNCTIVGNTADEDAGGIFSAGDITVANSILWQNTSNAGLTHNETAQIVVISGTLSVDYTVIDDFTGTLCGVGDPCGVGNSGADPLFTSGPLSCYYLSHSAARHGVQSPCIDAGGTSAAAEGVSSVTTRSDEATDDGLVDLGFHHPPTGRPFPLGDSDRNGGVSSSDFVDLRACFTGIGPAALTPCCRIFDLEADSDIDLHDAAAFQNAFDGQ